MHGFIAGHFVHIAGLRPAVSGGLRLGPRSYPWYQRPGKPDGGGGGLVGEMH
jgi:hypothetical protein